MHQLQIEDTWNSITSIVLPISPLAQAKLNQIYRSTMKKEILNNILVLNVLNNIALIPTLSNLNLEFDEGLRKYF